MPDPTPLPQPGSLPDPFGGPAGAVAPGGAPGPGAGALAAGRLGGFGVPAGGGANSDLQASYQNARGGSQPQVGNAADPFATNAIADPAAQYAALFGTTTPQTRVSQGLPTTGPIAPPPQPKPSVQPTPPVPAAPAVPPNGGGADNAPKAPAATPQQAGENNSIMPGWSTGNPFVGTPASDVGFSDKGPDTKSPASSSTASPASTPLPQPGQFPPVTTPVGAAALQAPVATSEPLAPGAAAGQAPGTTNEPATPLPQQSAAPTVQQKSAERAPGGQTATAPTSTVTYGGATITLPRTMTQQQFNALTPEQRAQLVRSTWKAPAELATITGTDLETALNGGKLDINRIPPHIRDDVVATMNLQKQLNDLQASHTGSVGSQAQLRNEARLEVQIRQAADKLAKNGITYKAAVPTPTGGGAGGGTSGGGTTGGTSGGGGTTGGTTAPPLGDQTQSDSSLLAAQGSVNEIFAAAFKASGGDYNRAMQLAQMYMNTKEYQDSRNDKATAVQNFGKYIDAATQDPRRAKAETLTSSILDNPDPTDWEAIRSRTRADAQAQGLASLRALGSSAARRLGSGAGGATMAMAGDIQRSANADLSNRLGDLTIQQSQARRQGELQALDAANREYQLFQQGDVTNAQNWGNMYMGAPAQYTSPTNDWLSSNLAVNAYNDATRAANSAQHAAQINQVTGMAQGGVGMYSQIKNAGSLASLAALFA